MANTLGVYNPTFYANEALIQLWKALGIASRIHVGFDAERRTFDKGDTISIRRPSTFAAQDAPGTASDLNTETVSISLNNWRTVKFSLTDKELAYTGERIVNDHIRPAAYALADDIDGKLAALWSETASLYTGTKGSANSVANIVGTRKVMREKSVPLSDAGNMFFMVGPALESDILQTTAFTQHQGGDGMAVESQRTGSIGRRYGFEFFANQNTKDGTFIDFTDVAGAVNNDPGPYAIGSTSIVLDALGAEAKIDKGKIVTFAGHTTEYVVTADATITSNAATITISPPLKATVANDEVVTIKNTTENATFAENLAFHRNWAALAMARLPDFSDMNGLGARIASIQDPVTGMSLRSRIYYVGASSKIEVALDVLYGYKVLDPHLGCRLEINNA